MFRKTPFSRSAGLAALLLMLVACGGGGSDGGGGNPPPPPPPPPPPTNVTVTGAVQFGRVPFLNVSPFGLNYAGTIMQPARGVTVRALQASNQAVLATGTTSATGAYSLSVPANTSITIQVMASMQRDATQPLPRWNVRVQNGAGTLGAYAYTGPAFNSSAGSHNIQIPTGISASGTTTGVRASGPFAILDTIYTAMQFIIAVEPQASFPALVVDWGSQNEGTFFSAAPPQRIALMADLTEDTDEFDQHVVAHEFGHYMEFNFSRADNIGGSHGLGDRLDKRVAFGEGFGYAFAAMVLGDPIARDSFFFNGSQVAFRFNVETNPPAGGGGAGCWCSESSVWSILWDLFDADSDTNDNVTLGFEPIWSVLKGAQQFTTSQTSIFSFIHALKAAQPQHAAAIDTLVAAQNINSATINPFATTETNAPFPNMLPVYTTITPGVPVVLRTIDDAGRHNKLGARRQLRFQADTSRTVTLSVATSNPDVNADPDFVVFRDGDFLGLSENPPPQTAETASFPVTAGSTYVFDVYDCANGCETEQGVPGDYDLTVTIN